MSWLELGRPLFYCSGTRNCIYSQKSDGFIETPCYDGALLKYGNAVAGPAVIEESKTTVIVPANYSLEVDKYGNFFMRRD